MLPTVGTPPMQGRFQNRETSNNIDSAIEGGPLWQGRKQQQGCHKQGIHKQTIVKLTKPGMPATSATEATAKTIQGAKSTKYCGNSMVNSSRDNRNNADVSRRREACNCKKISNSIPPRFSFRYARSCHPSLNLV
jgi:hypothetical protein